MILSAHRKDTCLHLIARKGTCAHTILSWRLFLVLWVGSCMIASCRSILHYLKATWGDYSCSCEVEISLRREDFHVKEGKRKGTNSTQYQTKRLVVYVSILYKKLFRGLEVTQDIFLTACWDNFDMTVETTVVFKTYREHLIPYQYLNKDFQQENYSISL